MEVLNSNYVQGVSMGQLDKFLFLPRNGDIQTDSVVRIRLGYKTGMRQLMPILTCLDISLILEGGISRGFEDHFTSAGNPKRYILLKL